MNVMEPLTEAQAAYKAENLYIADMLIPLGLEDACERVVEFDLWSALEPVPDPAERTLYTCRHWDRDSLQCTAYEARPKMCSAYPYGNRCEHGCDCADDYEERKAENSNPSA